MCSLVIFQISGSTAIPSVPQGEGVLRPSVCEDTCSPFPWDAQEINHILHFLKLKGRHETLPIRGTNLCDDL